MPFGLQDLGQTFQRFMDDVLGGLLHVFVYLDDILVASRTYAEHQRACGHCRHVWRPSETSRSQPPGVSYSSSWG